MVSDKTTKVKIVVIVGPTASGKSKLAWKLAKKYNGEIISADSRQVYRGMDIGTGKEKFPQPHNTTFDSGSKSRMAKQSNVDIWGQHLIDVADPTEDYNVSHFVRDAKKAIKDIASRGKLPIIVGGTGFWVDALIYDWQLPEVKPDLKLRARLEKLPVEKLFVKLQRLDPQRAKTIDRQNPRRLIRAIEIANSRISPRPPFTVKGGEGGYTALWLGIKVPQDELDYRIKQRLLEWLEQGLIEETKKLHDPDRFGLAYRSIAHYLRGELTYDQMVENAYRAIRQYSKRQMTWFKRNKAINWINPLDPPLR